jgi:hypothetical protein
MCSQLAIAIRDADKLSSGFQHYRLGPNASNLEGVTHLIAVEYNQHNQVCSFGYLVGFR